MAIKGKKIYLEEGFSNKQYSALLKWFNDIEIMKYIFFGKDVLTFKSIKRVKSFCQKVKDAKYFGIYSNKSKKLIGYAVIHDFKNKQCQLGIIIGDKTCWGEGIGYETTKLMAKYSFDKLGLEKICLKVSEYNKKAIRLYKKLGFDLIKKIPEDREAYHNNKWVKSAALRMELRKKSM